MEGASTTVAPPTAAEIDDIDEQVENGSRLAVMARLIRRIGHGADLTQVTIPGAFILPKSTLTYFSDNYSAHFDVLLKANDIEDEMERMLQVYRYLTTTTRNVEDVTKKPLNPILGETFEAKVAYSGEGNHSKAGEAHFFAEQISHHPPISSTVIYNKKEGISVAYHHPVRSNFMGTYVKLLVEGHVVIRLDKFDEVFTATCPSMAIRIFRMPSFSEYVGKNVLTSNKNTLKIKTLYHPKPLLLGSYNSIEATVYKGKDKVYKIKGHWDQELKYSEYKKDDYKQFFARNKLVPGVPAAPEEVLPTDSAKVWGGVFEAAKTGPAKNITKEKTKVEEEQRKKAAERKEKADEWKPLHFHQEKEGNWVLNVFKD
eukprot:gene15635-18575_t